MRHSRLLLAGVLASVLVSGCASAPPQEEVPSAESYFNQGLKTLEGRTVLFFFSDVDYPRAIELFQEVIDNYPYSEFATLAELKIADIHFDRGNHEEAQSYYQDFVELHPNHERVPYAIFRNGLCSFQEIRAADRDQEPTRQAIDQFNALIDRFPESEAAQEARFKKREAQDRLAEYAIRIADFYFDRAEYHAAIKRYREALVQFPEHSQRLHTMARLGVALIRVKQTEQAEGLLRQVLSENPEEDLRELVEAELAELAKLSASANGSPASPVR